KIVKTSPRHIGKICSQNKILLFIPCHRVINNNGGLGGFSGTGGINLKKKLLELEKLNS
ncbi:MAG: methylated-DNA--[protein]-cysteine S-methyltransferase, partial [Pelagibacterales bacterium]|nr:methylated-DNA--[protein]-cysteine S-methyltransferase [Pelagibacterales bacterium]